MWALRLQTHITNKEFIHCPNSSKYIFENVAEPLEVNITDNIFFLSFLELKLGGVDKKIFYPQFTLTSTMRYYFSRGNLPDIKISTFRTIVLK